MTATLTQDDRIIPLTPEERDVVLRGTLPEPLTMRFRRLGLRLHTQGTTRVVLTIATEQRTIVTPLWITNYRNAELMRARARER